MNDETARWRWRSFLRRRGVDPSLADFWASFARSQVEFSLGEPGARGEIGGLRFGGSPDLPDNVKWPTCCVPKHAGDVTATSAFASTPLSFLCQINLADLARCGELGLRLPKVGLMSVFYDFDGLPSGYHPDDGAGTQILYTPPSARLVQRPAPREATRYYSARSSTAQLRARSSIPDPLSISDECGRKDEKLLDLFLAREFENVLEDWDLASTGHAIGGWPASFEAQRELQLACQFAFNGLDSARDGRYQRIRGKRLAPGADQWRFLMQLSYAEDVEWTDPDEVGILHIFKNSNVASECSVGPTWALMSNC